MIILLIFLLGLSVGSFINALVYRLHAKKSWTSARSICPKCKHQLAWSDLIPIASFIFLRGQCRYCHKKISRQYPLVELAAGLLFVVTYYQNIGFNAPVTNYQLLITILGLYITAVLLIIFLYDLKHYLILDQVILPAILIVFFANLMLGGSWQKMLLAALVVCGFFLVQFLLSRGRWIGGGDLRLGFFMGIVLSWPQILVAVFLAYILGSIIGLALVALKLKKWQSKIPFAAFLCPAAFIALLWGEALLRWYLTMF